MLKDKDVLCDDLFRNRLIHIINPKHHLVRLSDVIDWDGLVVSLDLPAAATSGSGLGCPFISPRLMAGLLMLQQLEGIGDESVVSHWIENPYWQYFCGYDYLQWEMPCDPSSLTRWRNRLGVSGMEKLLAATITTGIATQAVKQSSMKCVVVDSTAMPNNITHPTDSKLRSDPQNLDSKIVNQVQDFCLRIG